MGLYSALAAGRPANPFLAFLIKLDGVNPPRRLQLSGSVLRALVHNFWISD